VIAQEEIDSRRNETAPGAGGIRAAKADYDDAKLNLDSRRCARRFPAASAESS